MKYTLIPIFFLTFMNPVKAQSLKAAADRLGEKVLTIGFSLSLFCAAVVGIFFMLGRKDAGEKASHFLVGVITLTTAQAVINFVRDVGA